MEQIRPFGALSDGREVCAVTLRSGALACEVLSFGAALRSLIMPDRTGRPTDVVLGFDRIEEYLAHDAHMGGTIGRFANRIARGAFVLNGETVRLPCNDGENHLHGGPDGFDRVLWTVCDVRADSVKLTLHSPDGDMGYPGDLEISVTYTLRPDCLTIRYEAVSDRDTLCSLTNHSYFNLGGHDSGDVLHQMLCLRASAYTPSDAGLIPTGELAPVAGTPLDFNVPTPIGARIGSNHPALRLAGGYDHNYAIDRTDCAAAWSDETGIMLRVETDRPGMQLYTGNFLGSTPPGKGGARYPKHGGFCLETQAFPDAPNHPQFPSAVLKAGERFASTTTYSFDTIGKER